ncbi:MAG: NUDIX domain-containing protein [Proteobacteria bacterium]|nr:NUDIX domain-containing protein [Pseudomonadota bacterium]
MAGRIAVVDEANHFVRWELRHTIHEQRLVHRSVHVLVFDSAGRLLVQRRHADKQTFPRYWDSSCAGHVEESDYGVGAGLDDELAEVYRAVAVRELTEELGIVVDVELMAWLAPEPGVHYEQIALYRARSDGPFTLQADEVEEYQLLAPAELAVLFASDEPVTPTLRYLWARFAATP